MNWALAMVKLDSLDALRKDPEAVRSFQNLIQNTNSATLASLNVGQFKDVSPDMIKTTSDVISKMSPDELQKMVDMASSFEVDNQFLRGGPPDSFNPRSMPPNVTPDIFKVASDMIKHERRQIPSKPGGHSHLVVLDLSYNHLSGELPSFVGDNSGKNSNGAAIQELDLSSNFFNGTLPNSLLKNLAAAAAGGSLVSLNVSNNSFIERKEDYDEVVAVDVNDEL
ncbi:Outer envelope protein [Vigna angularis]|uniref:Outer envelope protein n=1 Tax=Phaseolus angularis TaxID=3914 RepID=A0A8T0KI17_PHAAN|nr:Outer envelope protein [Vigna angularis]